MKLSALLVSQDPASLACLTALLARLEIDTEICTCTQAMQRLVGKSYTSVILDFDDPGAAHLAQMVRLVREDRPPLLIALVTELGPVSGAFQSGIKFVLHKPLKPHEAAQSLWDAKQFLRRDRRRLVRDRSKALIQLQVGGTTVPALLRDLSEQGLALQAPEQLPQTQKIPLRFVLPGTNHTIHAVGDVIWADAEGRAGLFFAKLTPASHDHLRRWFAHGHVKRRDAVRVLLPPRAHRSRPLVTT